MRSKLKHILVTFAIAFPLSLVATLSPCSYTEFYEKVDYSPDIKPGVWSGRSELCLKKARETGWLMLWFFAARGDKYDCKDFLQSNLCNQPFCDVVNNYKYLILCYEDYNSTAGRKLKNAIYGYPEPKKILDENTGEMVENHRGYPIHTLMGWTKTGEEIWSWCDYPPSIHLLKIDASTNIIFHICKREGVYEAEFSPYAAKFPIPSNMNVSMDKFAPWLKQYLDMYPVSEQIEEYEGAQTVTVDVEQKISEYVTNTVYQAKTIAVTETINPTVYQMALHRDNLLFRAVTMLGDVTVVDRIWDNFRDFDGRVLVKNSNGKWYVNHDRTIASRTSTVSDETAIDIYPNVGCTIELQQRIGNGFTFDGYEATVDTTITTQNVMAETGEMVSVTTTNSVVTTGASFMRSSVARNTLFSTNMLPGKLYRVTTTGNATFDVFSTK